MGRHLNQHIKQSQKAFDVLSNQNPKRRRERERFESCPVPFVHAPKPKPFKLRPGQADCT